MIEFIQYRHDIGKSQNNVLFLDNIVRIMQLKLIQKKVIIIQQLHCSITDINIEKIKAKKMNRTKLQLIKQTTSIQISQLTQILQCTPYTNGYFSQKFPIFPIIINFHIANPPFNRVSLCVEKPYVPSRILLEGSADAKQFFRFGVIEEFNKNGNADTNDKRQFCVLNLEEHHHYNYFRMKIQSPFQNSKLNICKQIWIKGIQLSFVTFFNCQYVCSLEQSMNTDPYLFRLLELLEYKSLLAKRKSKNSPRGEQLRFISAKYGQQLNNLLIKIKNMKQSTKKLTLPTRQLLASQMQKLIKQPLQYYNSQQVEYDRKGIRKQVEQLQKQMSDFYVHRLNMLHKDVTDYFHKYWNKQIKQEYLRLLSSPQHQDHTKALTNFWGEVKSIKKMTPELQEAIIMYFNYFLEYTHDPLKVTAIKILCLFFQNPELIYSAFFVFQRLLFNLYSQLSEGEQNRQQLYNISLKCIYTLFKKVPDTLFLQSLLNTEHSSKYSMKLLKLQILQRVTFKNVSLQMKNRKDIVNFILDVLSYKQLKLQQKNRAYNIIAYLASIYGKQPIMSQFQKLNSMLTMSMQKIVDAKLLLIKNPTPLAPQQQAASCQYCNISSSTFKSPHLFQLHRFKTCKYLTPCKHCLQMVEIPELFKHYIHNCEHRNMFKQCEECNEPIIKAKQDEHKKVCEKMLKTKCGLCGQKMQSKLKLKQHILKDGCPNNAKRE